MAQPNSTTNQQKPLAQPNPTTNQTKATNTTTNQQKPPAQLAQPKTNKTQIHISINFVEFPKPKTQTPEIW